jgi:methylase of polypeptide subunit release factors
MSLLERIAVQLNERRSAPPIPHLSTETLSALKHLIRESGYPAGRDGWNPDKPNEPNASLKILKCLFRDRGAILKDEAQKALAPLNIDGLIAKGLLREDHHLLKALFQLQVYEGLLFLADFIPAHPPADLVLPIGPSGKYLASLTMRRPIQTALDLGCGCGIQALFIGKHAQTVTAIDINPRATALTRLNAALNEVVNVEVLAGNYFEPLGDRRFDWIVANPPYVISPDKQYIYRDSGVPGDENVWKLIRNSTKHLTEGGQALIMAHWMHLEDESWENPFSARLDHSGVDAWLIHHQSMTPEEYANTWIGKDIKKNLRRFEQVKKRWLNWYRSRDIERIAGGVIALRRRSGAKNWICAVHTRKILSEPLGEHVQELFEAQDYLAKLGTPRDLLPKKLHSWNLKVEETQSEPVQACTTSGFLFQQKLRSATAAVLGHLDGCKNLGLAVDIAARKLAVEPASIQEPVAEDIYQLISLGMLKPEAG